MNKELQKLLKQINDKKNEVKSLVNDGKLDKAKAAKEELKELQNRFDLLYDLDEEEQDDIEDKVNNGTAKQVGGDVKPDKKNIVKSFVNIVKAGFLHKEADEADIRQQIRAMTRKPFPIFLHDSFFNSRCIFLNIITPSNVFVEYMYHSKNLDAIYACSSSAL